MKIFLLLPELNKGLIRIQPYLTISLVLWRVNNGLPRYNKGLLTVSEVFHKGFTRVQWEFNKDFKCLTRVSLGFNNDLRRV